MSVVVPAVATELTADEAASALSGAAGEAANSRRVTMLRAQSALEVGRWARMYNYNFANIKPGASWQGAVQPYAGELYRAYGNAADGAADFVSLLRRRYPLAWEAAAEGDVAAYVGALKKGGFFDAPEGQYRRAVESLYKEYGGAPAPPPSPDYDADGWSFPLVEFAGILLLWKRLRS